MKFQIKAMWESFVNWWVHKFNPHCEDCYNDREEAKICRNCDRLQNLLEIERAEKNKLLEYIIHGEQRISVEPKVYVAADEELRRKHQVRSWPNIRRELEHNDRIESERLRKEREANKPADEQGELDKLEEELGVGKDD